MNVRVPWITSRVPKARSRSRPHKLLETGACPGGGFIEGNFHEPSIGETETTNNPAEAVICSRIFCSDVEPKHSRREPGEGFSSTLAWGQVSSPARPIKGFNTLRSGFSLISAAEFPDNFHPARVAFQPLFWPLCRGFYDCLIPAQLLLLAGKTAGCWHTQFNCDFPPFHATHLSTASN
jgi:hypothetical protein